MMRTPRTIKAALLAGFLVIFAVWLVSTAYFTERLTEAQTRSATIQARYARGAELLSAVRSQVLLGSIYIRDALLDADPALGATVGAQLDNLQAQVNKELEQYKAIGAADEGTRWRELEAELRDFWETTLQLLGPESDGGQTAQTRLKTHIIPKREVILLLSDHLRQQMTEDLAREQQELDAANLQVRRRAWQTTLIAVVVGAIIAFLSTWHVRRLELAVLEDRAEVVQNRLELRELSGRLVRAQEDERRTIARELHDEIGQALTAVDVELAVAEGAVGTERAAAAIHEARTVTQRALASARDLSQLLRPSMLDDFGLPDTLKWYLRKFSARTGVRTDLVEDQVIERLPIDVEVCLYRVIQEALTNVSRHAQATVCRVFLQRLVSSVIVTVEDDGVGVPAVAAPNQGRRNGLGLVGIRERVSDLGGTCRIEGMSGKGTRLTIELPLLRRT